MSKNKGKTAEELLREALVPVEEQPYKVPENWVWVRLSACLEKVEYGYTESSSTEKIGPHFLRITDIQDDNVDWANVPYCKIPDNSLDKYILQSNDIVVARTGATTGKSFLIKDPPKAVFASYLIRLRANKLIDPRYLWTYMKSSIYWNQITVVKKGSAQPGANASILGKLLLPLPPLNEQLSIADKVESLIKKINEARQLIIEAEKTFELRRAAILDKAFRGELTANWRVENIKSVSGETTINFSEYEGVLNKIPDTWCWSKLKDFEGEEQLVLTGPFGTTLSNKDFVESGIPVLTIGCLQDEGINLNKANYVTEDKANTLNRYRVKEGDILFSRMATVGRASRVGKSFENCLINYHLMRVRLPRDINVDYFLLVVKGAPSTKLFLKSMNHGMTRDGINTKELLNLPIPFPPIEEQKMIVEFFSSLQEKEEQINQKIQFVESVLNQLQASILSTAFRGELSTNFEVEESSIEELKQLIKI